MSFTLTLSLCALVLLAGCSGGTRDRGPVGIGDIAPDFALRAGNDETIALRDYRGQVVVVFFYPKDNTSICTKEVCAFRDSYEVFEEHGAKVFGISSDSVDSHDAFAKAQRLNFPLLSDAGAKVRTLYGVPKTIGLIPGRVTYVIDKDGVVRHLFNSQKDAQKHVDEALKVVQALAK